MNCQTAKLLPGNPQFSADAFYRLFNIKSLPPKGFGNFRAGIGPRFPMASSQIAKLFTSVCEGEKE